VPNSAGADRHVECLRKTVLIQFRGLEADPAMVLEFQDTFGHRSKIIRACHLPNKPQTEL